MIFLSMLPNMLPGCKCQLFYASLHSPKQAVYFTSIINHCLLIDAAAITNFVALFCLLKHFCFYLQKLAWLSGGQILHRETGDVGWRNCPKQHVAFRSRLGEATERILPAEVETSHHKELFWNVRGRETARSQE